MPASINQQYTRLTSRHLELYKHKKKQDENAKNSTKTRVSREFSKSVQ
jgi:hypothetical protein